MRTILSHLLTPHHTNNYRARLLHPAGMSVLIGLFLLTQSTMALWKALPAIPGGLVLGYASSITTLQTVELTNQERARMGLSGLTFSETLSRAAEAKARHMFEHNYWSHIAPDGTTPWNFIRGAGYEYAVAGENLARDFDATESMLSAWMNSPTHKDNIVNPSYSEIGVAVVNGVLEGVETTLVVQMFGKPTSGVAVAQVPETAAVAEPDLTEPIGAQEILPEADLANEVDDELAALVEQQIAGAELSEPDRAVDTLGASLRAPSTYDQGSILISPLSLTRAIGTSIVLLVVGLLLYDTMVIHPKQFHRSIGRNWAHLTLFIFVMLIILTISQGRII